MRFIHSLHLLTNTFLPYSPAPDCPPRLRDSKGTPCCPQLAAGRTQALNINLRTESQARKQTSPRSSLPQTRVCQIQCSTINQILGGLRGATQGPELGCRHRQGPRLPSRRTSPFCWILGFLIFQPTECLTLHF